jgi:asparagine synthase (glutamine-hydrolysing)
VWNVAMGQCPLYRINFKKEDFMCGLAGCFGLNDETTISKMLDALEHRGPNDRGIYSHEQMVLGHTRLSIVDVALGHQPILTQDGRKGIICNGEIYNFKKLREHLSQKYSFQTNSDTEVILHLFQEKGPECVVDLDGMFSFALFDDDMFMLARDPIGIKPLYYGYLHDKLYFSSELGAMSFAGVNEVHEFPAGHYYTPEDGFVQYYRVPEIQDSLVTNCDDACALIRKRFIDAVRKRLLADPTIPVGSFCSGGLDSSLIAAIAADEIPHLHTFAVGMADESGDVSDDIKAARIAAEHIQSTHHELIFTEEDYYKSLPTVIKKLESYDPSLVRCAVPCYFTCKLAAEHVTVVLTGEGADEVFAGYHYMKNFPFDAVNMETRRLLAGLHNINLQRADRMGMLFSLELRVPFLDVAMVDLAMKIPPEFKIHEHNGKKIEKWILRKSFEYTDYLPEEILWRYKVQYTQGAGCESLGEKLAEAEISDEEYERIKHENPHAVINGKEAAYYFKIFKKYHPQESVLKSIGIWTGFDFVEERESVRGTVGGDVKYSSSMCGLNVDLKAKKKGNT